MVLDPNASRFHSSLLRAQLLKGKSLFCFSSLQLVSVVVQGLLWRLLNPAPSMQSIYLERESSCLSYLTLGFYTEGNYLVCQFTVPNIIIKYIYIYIYEKRGGGFC